MDINNVKPEMPERANDAKQAKISESAEKSSGAPPSKQADSAKGTTGADNTGLSVVKRHYVAPDLSGSADLMRDLSRVNSELKMMDLKRYSYESDIERIKSGFSEKDRDFYAQLHDINVLKSKITETGADRAQKMKELQEKINSGEYKPDAKKITEALDKYREGQ